MREPLDSFWITAPYGERIHPVTGLPQFHEGRDLGAPSGTPIHLITGATVVGNGQNRAGGYYTFLRLDNDDVWRGYHMRTPGILRPGRHYDEGEILGYVGATGDATGPHLHEQIEVDGHTVDPTEYHAQITVAGTGTPITEETDTTMARAVVNEQQGTPDFATIAVVTENGQLHIVTPENRPWWDNLAACYEPTLKAHSVNQEQYSTFVAAQQAR